MKLFSTEGFSVYKKKTKFWLIEYLLKIKILKKLWNTLLEIKHLAAF